jgi:hypothetical protein
VRPVETVIALIGKLFGLTLPKKTASACLRFARLAGSDLLGISLFRNANQEWMLSSANPYPDLTSGGQELINHLCKTLKGTKQ